MTHHAPARRSDNPVDGPVFVVSFQAHTTNGNVTFSPPRTLVPAQLRVLSPLFTNRPAELRMFAERLLPAGADPPTLVMLSGVGGCGMTAWAVQWAHSVRRQFGDGQIFVDLGDYSGDRSGPLEPRVVLERLLRCLLGRKAA